MRALRDRDAWLPTDLGVRHALARIGHDGDAERWRPFRAYAVVHLWCAAQFGAGTIRMYGFGDSQPSG